MQDDMTQFRTKLVAILLTTDLNKLKGCPLTKNDDDDIGSPSDVEYITSNKRKRCHSDKDEKKEKHYVEEDQNKMKDDTHKDEEKEKYYVEEVQNKMIDDTPLHELLQLLDAEGDVVDIPTTDDLIDIVCDMITIIDDTAVLE